MPAALAATLRVIDEVKKISGISDDADSLINKAFGIDQQIPIIRFNNLETEGQREQQRATLCLFKGIVPASSDISFQYSSTNR